MEQDPASTHSADVLRQVDLFPPEHIQPLVPPSVLDFGSASSYHRDEARSLLVQQRTNEPGYKPPEQQIRSRLRSSRVREQRLDQGKWIFTNAEVAKAFDSLLKRKPLAQPGTAQALLSHASSVPLDELWCCLHAPTGLRRVSSLLKRSSSIVFPKRTWLDDVTEREELDYVRLLCQRGVGQGALDRAFGIALSKYSMRAMEVLLAFGAAASSCKDLICERLKTGDVALTKLLLSAPAMMDIECWRDCLEAQPQGSSAVLLLCLAHQPKIADGPLLLRALELQDLQFTGIVLAYSPIQDGLIAYRDVACLRASQGQDAETKRKLLVLLADCGLASNSLVLQEELFQAVQCRHLPLVRSLTNAGVTIDAEPRNALNLAIAHMDLDILELFRKGKCSLPVSSALSHAPQWAAEKDIIQVLDILAPRGISGEPLHRQLVRAVSQGRTQLAQALLQKGASPEFDQASSVRLALEQGNLHLLGILLKYDCSARILTGLIDIALAMQNQESRLSAMKALLDKGVSRDKLGSKLYTLVSSEGDKDLELIQLLLKHKAPLSEAGEGANNVISLAARKGDLSLLKTLCDAGPPANLLSNACPIAFKRMEEKDYRGALKAIELLLRHGATGDPVHKTLAMACEHERALDIVACLLRNSADANHADGAPFVYAVKTLNIRLLNMLCLWCPPRAASIQRMFETAVDSQYFNGQILGFLLRSCFTKSPAVLTDFWASDGLRRNINLLAIVRCGKQAGLDVNHLNQTVLSTAFEDGNIALLREVLPGLASIGKLAASFQATTKYPASVIRFSMMKLLLDRTESREIGQTAALPQFTAFAVKGDSTGLKLLLQHNASVDVENGMAVALAAVASSFEVLHLLLAKGPSVSSRKNACLATACSALSQSQKSTVLKILLAANGGFASEDGADLLATAIERQSERTDLPLLLMSLGFKANFSVHHAALAKTPLKLLFALIDSNAVANPPRTVFRRASGVNMRPSRRHGIYEHLLRSSIPEVDITQALLEFIKAGDLEDLSVPKLLLGHGASVWHGKYSAFRLAFQAKSVNTVRLLCQKIDTNSMAGKILELAREAAFDQPTARADIYRCLTKWTINEKTLVAAIKDSLVVEAGGNGAIRPRSKEVALAEFKALCRHVNPDVVLKLLFADDRSEMFVVRAFAAYLDDRPPGSSRIKQDDLLFQCLRKFPRGTALLDLLLANGISAAAMINHRICPAWAPEDCTVLIWALSRRESQEIGNEPLLLLLSKGNAAMPGYKSRKTEVSAAFCCLLSKSRTPVLKALLKLLGKDGAMRASIPGASLGYMGGYPFKSKDDQSACNIGDRLDLRMASLYMGNPDAFRLLNSGHAPDDGMLHLAALFQLPEIVKILLKDHDPNYQDFDEFDKFIPLAMACQRQKPLPWCKVANAEGPDFPARKKETMQLLASRTDLKWRHRGRTVLHIAFEHGIESTAAMAEALGYRTDSLRETTYVYTDRAGKDHSPVEYIQAFVDGNHAEKAALATALLGNRASRFLWPTG